MICSVYTYICIYIIIGGWDRRSQTNTGSSGMMMDLVLKEVDGSPKPRWDKFSTVNGSPRDCPESHTK